MKALFALDILSKPRESEWSWSLQERVATTNGRMNSERDDFAVWLLLSKTGWLEEILQKVRGLQKAFLRVTKSSVHHSSTFPFLLNHGCMGLSTFLVIDLVLGGGGFNSRCVGRERFDPNNFAIDPPPTNTAGLGFVFDTMLWL